MKDEAALAALHRFGKHVVSEFGEIENMPDQTDGDITIIAGHAIFSNFVAYHATQCKDEALLHIPLGEAGRIRLAFEGEIDGQPEYVGFTIDPKPEVLSGHPD